AAVVTTRADLVAGARDLPAARLVGAPRVSRRAFTLGALLVAILFAAVVSQFAFDDPDGLERVAADEGFLDQAGDHALDHVVFADYATRGIGNENVSLAVAGLAGVVITLVVGYGMVGSSRWLAARPPT